MAVGKITKQYIDKNYTNVSAHEKELGLDTQIVKTLGLLFYIAQAEEAKSAVDFFSGRNLPIAECFEDLNASYELIKMGITKHAFVALRVAIDDGLLAAYWKVVGHETKAFKKWLQSIDPTPQKKKVFWETLKSHHGIKVFFSQFPIEDMIKDLGELSNYIHTRGSEYSAVTDFQRRARSGNPYAHFDDWYKVFRSVSRVAVILQLLVNPKLTLEVPIDKLLRKFGTFDKIPFMGVLIGEYGKEFESLVGIDEYRMLKKIASGTTTVKSVLRYIDATADLSDDNIKDLIIVEQKNHILEEGFLSWYSNRQMYDHRIDDKMTVQLQSWVEGLKLGNH